MEKNEKQRNRSLSNLPLDLIGSILSRLPVNSIYVYFNIVGSCNGLLLINLKNDALVLWNPSTRVSRELPESPIEFPTCSRKCLSTVYGFGYDSFADDYKLVRVVTFATERFETEVKLYSLGTNSWKRIEDFPYGVPNKSDGIFVNGALHWLVYLENDLVCLYFVSYLDLSEEKYGWLELPDYESGQSFCDIGVLGGCLHMY
ncbi:hypothetical protein ACB092_07G041000 [Castanea dentata]